MGQYYLTVNLDKKQYLYPHKFGEGLKLLEFGCDTGGTMTALAALLCDGNGRGGGDLDSDDPIIGSWAGDRIVVAGDYAEPGNFITDEMVAEFNEKVKISRQCFRNDSDYREEDQASGPDDLTLYRYAEACCEDVSAVVKGAIRDILIS